MRLHWQGFRASFAAHCFMQSTFARLHSFAAQRFHWIVTVVFFVVAAWGLAEHEMWRDEHQTWLSARDSNSYLDLYRNTIYDGHPILWHSILWIFSKFTSAFQTVQVVNLAFGTAAIFLLNKHAPFPKLWRVLITFNYFFLYEYTVISRSYGLGLLLVIALCAAYHLRFRRPWVIAMLLFLLANTSVYGCIISLCFTGIILFDLMSGWKEHSLRGIRIITSLVFALSGASLAIYMIYPEEDNGFYISKVSSFDLSHLYYTLDKVVTAYIPVPDLSRYDFWNTIAYRSDDAVLSPAIAIILLAATACMFINRPKIFLLYATGTGLLLAFVYYTNLAYARYTGHFFVLLVACLWLAGNYAERHFASRITNSISKAGIRIRSVLIPLLLAAGAVGGIGAWAGDLEKEFSASRKAAAYIQNEKLDTLPIVGSADYVISCLPSILNKKDIYYVEKSDWGTFLIWNNKRKYKIEAEDIVRSVERVTEQYNKVLLVLSKPLPALTLFDEKNIKVRYLNEYTSSVVADEVYYIYLAERID